MIEIGKGGLRATDEFWLNREQAIYLTTQAGTPKARALTVLVVSVEERRSRATPVHVDCMLAIDLHLS